MKKTISVVIIFICIIFLINCEKDSTNPTEPVNQAPTIISLIATPDSLNPGENSTVVCLTNDLDGDSLNYSWNATNGTINGSGAIVEWLAPNFNGNQNITCIINDNHGGIDSATISINVFNSQPMISSLQSISDSIKIGGSVSITCIANDQDGDSLTYIWNSASGIISGTGLTINWTAPNAVGIHPIFCKVLDGNGGMDSSEIHIEVILLPISTQGLIGYWPLIGNANDESGNENDGLVVGAQLTNDYSGNPNSAYLFDGIDDYIEISGDAILKPQLPISISMWINYADLNGNIFTSNYHATNYYGFSIGASPLSNRINISFHDGGPIGPLARRTKYISHTNPDTWFHFVGIIRGATDMDIYTNGVNAGGNYSGSGGAIAYDNGHMNIGRHDTDNSGPPRYLKGQLDEIIIFNRVLTPQEVQKLYQNNK